MTKSVGSWLNYSDSECQEWELCHSAGSKLIQPQVVNIWLNHPELNPRIEMLRISQTPCVKYAHVGILRFEIFGHVYTLPRMPHIYCRLSGSVFVLLWP